MHDDPLELEEELHPVDKPFSQITVEVDVQVSLPGAGVYPAAQEVFPFTQVANTQIPTPPEEELPEEELEEEAFGQQYISPDEQEGLSLLFLH